MTKEKILTPVMAIHLAGLLFVAAGFATNPLKLTRAFYSDESVYYTMAYSFAYDGDMEFQQIDLVRVYREFSAGPQGIVLKLNERDNTIVFGKAFLYSLVAAPFVWLFGTNGFFILHGLLLWLNLLCAYVFGSKFMRPSMAALFSLFYFIANASLVYLFWMTPEYFNMSLVCYAMFFFVADETLKSKWKPLTSPFNYVIAALLLAMATYSKLTNATLVVPLGIWMLYRRKIIPAMLTLSAYILVSVGLFGMNVYFTGDWNYQGGKRSVFYDSFPYGRAGASPFAPFKQRKEVDVGITSYRPPFVRQAFLYNWVYFFFGRYSGFAIYFLPMFFVLLYYLFGKKSGLATAVYATGWAGILTYMVGIPWNYFGGSGTIGNRYLMNSFAVFAFCLQQEPSRKWLTAGFCSSLLFTSAFLFTPVKSSFDNAYHQKRSLFTWLPLERTLLADLPINANVLARRIAFDDHPHYLLYFADNNSYYKEAYDHLYGFWVKGNSTCEFVIRAFQPVTRLKILVKSIQTGNHVTVDTGLGETSIDLKEPVFYQGEVPLPDPLPYNRDGTGNTYLYTVKVRSETGMIATQDNGVERYLGAFVRIELPESEGVQIPQEEVDAQ